MKCGHAYLRHEENSNIHTLTLDKIYRFLLKVYPPSFWRTWPQLFWRGVLGNSACCEEECKPIIIRDADKALNFIFPETIYYITIVKKDLSHFKYAAYLTGNCPFISHKFIQNGCTLSYPFRSLFPLPFKLTKQYLS